MGVVRKILIINLGSSSKKYAFYDNKKQIAFGNFELSKATITINGMKQERDVSSIDYTQAFLFFTNAIDVNVDDIDRIGIRVVAPGTFFQENRIMDRDYIKKLKAAMEIAPLHISQTLQEYSYLNKKFPHIPVVAVSDSAFHTTIPKRNQQYAIDSIDARRYDIKKFGYHGISLQSVTNQIKDLKLTKTEKVIICHLGSGSSITVLKNFKSVDTSMGFTPLSGIPMATRPGDIDAGLITFLWKKKKWNPDDALNYFSTKCGLKGISGNADMRINISLMRKKDENATNAFNNYIQEIKKTIGGYIATQNGLDVLIFTGGIGEHSEEVREAVCNKMEHLGISLSQQLNKKKLKKTALINDTKSFVKIAIVPTEEEKEMFNQVENFKNI